MFYPSARSSKTLPIRSRHFLFFLFFSVAQVGIAQSIQLDSAQVVAFLDGVMATQLKNKHIAGATVAIVQHKRTILAKGYGYADLDKKIPVDAETTLFRIGSISKLFIWTAVMQLASQDKLDLNTDINRYCTDFKVPPAFGKPITLLDLMNHTAGFEDQVVGLFGKSPTDMRPLGDILQEQMPERIWAPGLISSYSNHGSAIAAYIVEQVSGMSWNEYVEKHILQPLDMSHTSFRQPLPDTLIDALSMGYRYTLGQPKKAPFEYVPLAPVGAASASARDMARFMRAHLQWGKLGTARILDSLTAVAMRQPSFRHAPGMNPMRHGFIDMSQYGQDIFGHGGDTEIFHSDLALFPAHGIGLFVSFNSAEGGGVSKYILEAFIEHFFPKPQIPVLQPDATQAASLAYLAGSYRSNRFTRSDLSKIAALQGQVRITITPEGYVQTHTSKEIKRWVQIDDLLFQEANGLDQLAFRADDQGRITHFFMRNIPVIAFERVPVLEESRLNTGLIVFSVGTLLLALIGWPLGIWFRHRYDVRAVRAHLIPEAARWMGWVAALTMLLFLIGLVVQLGDPFGIVYGIPTGLKRWLLLPWVLLFLTLATTWHALQLWGKGIGRLSARIGYTLVCIALAVCFWLLWNWKLFAL